MAANSAHYAVRASGYRGHPVEVWAHPDASFSWTVKAIEIYAEREQWESVFNALVLLGDSAPKGVGA